MTYGRNYKQPAKPSPVLMAKRAHAQAIAVILARNPGWTLAQAEAEVKRIERETKR